MKNLVWLVSYPKSGNTWFRIFLTNYLKNCQEPAKLDEIERTPLSSEAGLFEECTGLNPFEMTPEEVDLYRPGVYRLFSKETGDNVSYRKTHDAYSFNIQGEPLFPSDISKGVVYFIRNPLDVCVSYANHSAGKIGSSIRFLLNDKAEMAGKKGGQLRQTLFSWKGHLESWQNQKDIPVHFVRYEDMKQKPVETFGSIIEFLNLEYKEERLLRAIKNSDFNLLQQMEKESGFGEKMQLCKSFFWKGEIGNYRNHLSEDDIKKIVGYNYDTMKSFGYIDQNNQLTV